MITTGMKRHETRGGPGVAGTLVVDVLCVVAFALVGRRSHAHALDPAGVAQTAWPFVVGLLAGWLLVVALTRRAPVTWIAALPVWLLTVFVGMALRSATHQPVAPAFVVVATIATGLLLLGWRVVVPWARRRAAGRHG